jgi:hypothetical protein
LSASSLVEPAEFVLCELGGPLVVRGGLLGGAQGGELQQRPGVAGQYMLPLAMIALWWVPCGPR